MDADVFISLTHFKGHGGRRCGFGGTIKNIGMGCGSRAWKMEQHCEGKPSVATEACIGVVEPAAESVHTERRSSQITKQKLIMINVLAAEDVLQSVQRDAISADYADSVAMLNYKMAEYSLAVCQNRPCFHVSLIRDVSPNCDCQFRE